MTIRLLVATKEGQGGRKSDFCHVPEGEPLHYTFECDTDRRNIDGPCGCRRSMSGLLCKTACTTFKVADVDMTKDQLEEHLFQHYHEGWKFEEKKARKYAKADADSLLEMAAWFDEHRKDQEIIEKRGNKFQFRLGHKVKAA